MVPDRKWRSRGQLSAASRVRLVGIQLGQRRWTGSTLMQHERSQQPHHCAQQPRAAVHPHRIASQRGHSRAIGVGSVSARSSQNRMSISRYIAVAVVRCSCACSREPARR